MVLKSVSAFFSLLRHFRLVFGLLMCIGATTGCGYQFQGGGSALPLDVKKVYIPIVENRTPRPTLAALTTEALRDQFDRYGVITVVDSLDQADAVLRMRLLSYESRTSASTAAGDTSLQEQLTLTAAGELQRVNGTLLWSSQGLAITKYIGTAANTVVTTSAAFASSGVSAGNLAGLQGREVSRGQEEQALQAIAEELSAKVYADSVTPDF